MAKSKKAKPSFGSSDEKRAGAAWVYRSDAGARPKASASARARKPRAARKSSRTADAPKGEAKGAPTKRPAAAPAVASNRVAAAHLLVDRYVKYSTAAGLVPVPVVDVIAIAGVQVRMLGALASQYDVPYDRERGKTLIATILGGLMPSLAGYQMLKVFGPIAGMASVAGFAAATTYAVGHVFIAHFESGGTLLNLDVEQIRRRLSAALARR